jgi:hypothetical protein
VPDLRVVLYGQRGDHRRRDIVEADVARAATLAGQTVHGVATNVGSRIPERSGEHVRRGAVAT